MFGHPLRGRVRAGGVDSVLNILDVDGLLEAIDVAGADQVALEAEDGVRVHGAAAEEDFGAEEVALFGDGAAGLEGLDPEQSVTGAVGAGGAGRGEADLPGQLIGGENRGEVRGRRGGRALGLSTGVEGGVAAR